MQQQKTFIAIIVMLTVALIIALGGWIKTRSGISGLNNPKNLGDPSLSLAVCDDLKTEGDDEVCTKKLIELSQLLSKYEQKIRSIKSINQ